MKFSEIMAALGLVMAFAAITLGAIGIFHETEEKMRCRGSGGVMIQDFGCVDAKKLKELRK